MAGESNIIQAFTEEQVERLTGVTRHQLRYWDRTGFFAPSLADENRRRPYSRVYTFRDVLCLKIINTLRNEVRVSLPHLRDVKDKLSHLGDSMWANTTLYVLDRKVIFDNPETRAREEVVTGQGVLQIPLKVITGDMERAVKTMNSRSSSSFGQIEQKKGVAGSQPVIAGTRVPVRAIKAFKEAGYSELKICEQYPGLTRKDIRAALEYDDAA